MLSTLRHFVEKGQPRWFELSERVGKYIHTEEFLKKKDLGFADDESIRAKRKRKGSEKGPRKKPRQTSEREIGI